jgi:hypothetical protein
LPAARDRGSAIAEFAMVSALLLFVALGVFQIGLALYVRNTLISAASEGARYAARADAEPADGVARTRALITSSLSARFAQDVDVDERTTPDGVRVVEVTVRAPLPVVGPLGPSESLAVSGRAFSEDQVSAGSVSHGAGGTPQAGSPSGREEAAAPGPPTRGTGP